MTQTLEHPTAIDRLSIYKVSPELYDAMMKLSDRVGQGRRPDHRRADQDPRLQINHCAFCLDMHVADARKHGETEQRLALVAAWEEAGDLFTDAGAGGPRADRGDHRTAPRPRLRRGLRQGRRGVHREGARPGDRDGRHHQRVEPLQRGDHADEGPAPLTPLRERVRRFTRADSTSRYTQYGTRERYCRIANAVTVQPTMVSTITTTQCRSSWSAPSSGARTMST